MSTVQYTKYRPKLNLIVTEVLRFRQQAFFVLNAFRPICFSFPIRFRSKFASGFRTSHAGYLPEDVVTIHVSVQQLQQLLCLRRATRPRPSGANVITAYAHG